MNSGEPFPIQNSNLYIVWLEEQEHIARNRWYMSERVGYDVGYHAAKSDWSIRFRQQWIASLRASGRYPTV